MTHDSLVVSFVEFDALLELLFETLDGGLEVRSFFDEFFLLVDALHLFLVLLLHILPIDFDNFGFESFVVLNRESLTVMKF